MTPDELLFFVRESNRIEGIKRAPTKAELDATEAFLLAVNPSIADVCALVSVLQPGAILRIHSGLNVRVGNHIAPPGGTNIAEKLGEILEQAHGDVDTPFNLHRAYETLHPFTDGNGRSGRALWAWQMLAFNYWPRLRIGFLHAFYYQTLESS